MKQLLSDRLFIKPIEKPIIKKSGLILPSLEGGVNETEYKVLQAGAKCKGVKTGDTIRLYPQVDKIPYEDGYFIRESADIKVVL